MATKLYTSAAWYNPFYMDGLEIDHIYFYRDGKIIAETNWFGGDNKYWNLQFAFETKRAAKLNLNRQDAFYMRSDCDWKKAYNLYIHADLVDLKSLGRQDYINDWKSNSTIEYFTITLDGERKVYSKNETTGDKMIGREKGVFVEKFSCNYQSEVTKEYQKCQAIAEKWKKLTYRDFTASDIHAIMEAYNISEKRIKK